MVKGDFLQRNAQTVGGNYLGSSLIWYGRTLILGGMSVLVKFTGLMATAFAGYLAAAGAEADPLWETMSRFDQ